MSQVLVLRRIISQNEIEDAVHQINSFKVKEKHDWGLMLTNTYQPDAHIAFVNGEFQVTSPSDKLYEQLQLLASCLGAEIIHEEDEMIPEEQSGTGNVRTMSIFWPCISALLLGLLAWKW